MKDLPLFYYPTSLIFLDDDRLLLNSMEYAFGKEYHIYGFTSSKECLDFLKNYEPPSAKHIFLKSNPQDENFGSLQKTPIDFDLTSIKNLAKDPNRKNEITVAIIDYSLPEMNGLSFAKSINQFPIQKILLTGIAPESDAVIGFNENLIHRYVQKSETAMFDKLSLFLRELSFNYFHQLSANFLRLLETESILPLTDPVFSEFFMNYCREYNIVEYYLIDKMGSFLCIDQSGRKSYLAIQSECGIHAWLELYAKDAAISEKTCIQLQNGELIPFFGLGKEAWQFHPDEWSNHFYVPNQLKGRERYFWKKIEE